MKYEELVSVYSELEATSKRLEKTHILSEFLKKISKEDMEFIVYLLQGKVFPVWDESKIGVAARIVIKAISIATGRKSDTVENEWKRTGDLGLVAENLIAKKKQATLFSTDITVKKVFNNLRKLATTEGTGSVDQKIGLISELLTSAKPLEARYIVRTVLDDLRVGVATGTMRDAIVWAFLYNTDYDKIEKKMDLDKREDYKKVVEVAQNAYNMCNDFSMVAIAAKVGISSLKKIKLQVGRPVQVMLGPKEPTIEAAFKRVGKPAALEYKYDGFRMLVHKGKRVDIFTRRLENVTKQFPEVVRYINENVKAHSFIIDGEGVGFDAKTNKYQPFQQISQRIRRKYGIDEIARKLPVEFNVFDILYYDGKSVIDEPFRRRRKLLQSIVKEAPKKIVLSTQIITDDETKATEFFDEAKKKGFEGIMFKAIDSPYKPGSRVGHMVKYKTAMETLDLVVVGAEWGEGKRSGWLTSFTVACKTDDGVMTIGKVGTGIKELEAEGLSFNELTNMLKPHIISEKGREVKIRPAIVLEIKFEEIQKSPTYESGYALRFPRVVRDRTMERGIDDASDLDYVEELFRQQKK
ncbi:MAG: ATP-dependent DNA ligase [Nanoarchaeota archaeon]|nr:ATP-dependent DNA ligase [Nanoarchaeota archaeon]